MPEFADPLDQLSATSRARLEKIIEEYETAWASGQVPTLADYLPSEEPERHIALGELIFVDLDCRHRARLRVDIAPYLAAFPELQQTPDLVAELHTRQTTLRQKESAAAIEIPENLQVCVILEVVAGPHQDQRFEIDKPTVFVVGRSSRANLPLPDDRFFSRLHFQLELDPPRCYLRDLNSHNGTFLNGARIQEGFIKSGDIFGGGRTLLRLRVKFVGA